MAEQKYIPLDVAIAAIEAIPKGNWKNSRYTRAIAAIPAADVVERPRRIPVEERLPEEDVDVLVFTNEGEMFKAQYMGIMGGETIFDDYNGSGWGRRMTNNETYL